MQTLDKRLIRTMARSKLQFIAIVVIITLGLAAYVVLNNAYQNLDHSLETYYEKQNFGHVFARFTPQPAGAIDAMEGLPEISVSEGRIVSDVEIDVGRDTYPDIRLVGLSEDGRLNRPLIIEGQMPAAGSAREIALGSRFAVANNLSVGDELDLMVRGESISVLVSGIAESPEFIYAIKDIQMLIPDEENFGIAFAEIELVRDLLGMTGQINDASFLVSKGTDYETAKEAVEDALTGRGLREVVTRDNQLSHFIISLELEQLERMSLMVPVIFLVIAAAILYMLLMRMVEADRTAIGVLKAIGCRNRQVLMHYLKYSLSLGFVGAIFGMALGHLAVGPVMDLYLEFFELPMVETRIDAGFILGGILLTLMFCGGAGLWAVRGILSITPADAMKPPAPPPGQKNTLEIGFPRWWRRRPFFHKLVLRQLFRNKKRFLLAVLGVAFAFTIVVMPFYMLGVVDAMFFDQFEVYDLFNHSVTFEHPVSREGVKGLEELVSFNDMEAFIEYPFGIRRGWREETVMIRALPQNSKLQRFEDERGDLIGVPATGLLISEYLATTLGVRTGDEVVVSSHVTGEREYTIPVRAIVKQYLGSGAYVSHHEMQRMIRDGDLYSGVLLQSDEDVRFALRKVGNVASVFSTDQIIEGFEDFLGLIIAAYTLLISIGGVLAFAILFNTTSVSISERTREFSSMRVLGYGRWAIFRLLVYENVMAMGVGIILGIPMARITTTALAEFVRSELFYLPALIQPRAYGIAGGLVTVFVFLVMVAIWYRIKQLDLLESLSSRMT